MRRALTFPVYKTGASLSMRDWHVFTAVTTQRSYKMNGYFGLLHGHALGDSLAVISHDVHLHNRGIESYYYVAFTGGPNSPDMERGWINWPLFSLYARAGLFKQLIILDSLNYDKWNGRWQEYAPQISAYIERNYGKQYTELLHQQPFLPRWKAIPCADDLRERFSFLRCATEPYATLHFASSHYLYADNVGDLPHTKRASTDAVLRELEECRQFAKVKMVGSLRDRSTVRAAIKKLTVAFPKIVFEDCTGTSVEGLFRILYNSKRHIACETGTPFFTAQLGIPSTQIYLSYKTMSYFNGYPTARANFEPFFSDISALKCVTDDVQVCGTDNEDLR